MIKKAWDTHTSVLISALKSASQVSSAWEESFEKNLWETERVTDCDSWVVMSKNNVPQINKLSHLKNFNSKTLNVWKSFISETSLPLIGMESKGFFKGVWAQTTTICTLYLLHSVLLCTNVPIEVVLVSKRRYAKQLIPFFVFRFLLCRANLTPVLHQVCISLIPLSFNPPLYIYTPAARNEWFTWRGSLPPSESFATIHYSPASISLISLCCVTLETPLRSLTCFFFFPRSLSCSFSELHSVLTVYAF